ncbi:hypothetical protein QQY66_11485 [Streptomyces sp. DG2A-72]|nr:hypothetical protein [Streptomyces sp. DG2A-72]MDO0932279.1 hypothetical protein [Streptomyces sp. DG2A-72]
MQVERDVESRRGLKDRMEVRVVEEPSPGIAVDHRSDKAQLADGALQFGCGRIRSADGQGGEGGKPVRVGGDGFVQGVVECAGDLRWRFLDRRRHEGEHLDVDTGGVHLLQPDVRVHELVVLRRWHPRDVHACGGEEVRGREMLFDGDDTHAFSYGCDGNKRDVVGVWS